MFAAIFKTEVSNCHSGDGKRSVSKHLPRVAVWFGVLAAPCLASAQAPVTPIANEEAITVTGIREGSRIAIVDYDKVWRRCAECKRALARLAELSKPYTAKKGEVIRDATAYNESVANHTGHAKAVSSTESIGTGKQRVDGMSAGRFEGMLADIQQCDTVELSVIRMDVAKLTASFLRQLDPHVRAAAENERLNQNAVAVIGKRSKQPPGKVVRVDITEAVIKRLDATNFKIALPERL